jgi:hypothetical protein
MTIHHEYMRPKVTEIRITRPTGPAQGAARPTQRDLVLASLLRCPGPRSARRGGLA